MPISSWAKVKVLVWADIVPYFVLWMLLTYLTDVWNLNYTRSAEIVNLFYGMVAIMPVAMQLILDTFLGDYWMVVLSSFAYTAGLGLLTLSTPPVLSRVTGNCSEYESLCLGLVQKLLFYTALLLIALGMAGHLTSVQTLVDRERRTTSPTPRIMFSREWILKVFGPVTVGFALGYIKSWWVLFAIAALSSLGATVIFLTRSYVKCPQSRDSALTTMLRVFVASAFKIFRTHRGWDKLYGANDSSIDQIPYTPRLRFLDKAAMKLPAQENNRWRLCKLTEVEETKSLIYFLPLCMNFILIGVVASIGNTYFVETSKPLESQG